MRLWLLRFAQGHAPWATLLGGYATDPRVHAVAAHSTEPLQRETQSADLHTLAIGGSRGAGGFAELGSTRPTRGASRTGLRTLKVTPSSELAAVALSF